MKRLIFSLIVCCLMVTTSTAQSDWYVYLLDTSVSSIIRLHADGSTETFSLGTIDPFAFFDADVRISDDGQRVGYCAASNSVYNEEVQSQTLIVRDIDTETDILSLDVGEWLWCIASGLSADGSLVAVTLNAGSPDDNQPLWVLRVYEVATGNIIAEVTDLDQTVIMKNWIADNAEDWSLDDLPHPRASYYAVRLTEIDMTFRSHLFFPFVDVPISTGIFDVDYTYHWNFSSGTVTLDDEVPYRMRTPTLNDGSIVAVTIDENYAYTPSDLYPERAGNTVVIRTGDTEDILYRRGDRAILNATWAYDGDWVAIREYFPDTRQSNIVFVNREQETYIIENTFGTMWNVPDGLLLARYETINNDRERYWVEWVTVDGNNTLLYEAQGGSATNPIVIWSPPVTGE